LSDVAATLPPHAPIRRTARRTAQLTPMAWLALAAAGFAMLPIVAVAANLLLSPGDAWAHLWATTLPAILANTALLLVGVGAGTLVLGVACAWFVTMCRFPFSRALELGLLLPMAIPAYIIGYAYTDLLQFAGPVQTALRDVFGWRRGDYWFPDIQSLGGAVAMLVLVLYPYVYLLARAAFLEQSVCVLEASRVLGRNAWGAFARVALPLARPAIAAGVALALMEALADFGTVQYFGVDTFTTAIYRTWFGMGNRIAASQLATALLAFVLVLLWLERSSRGAARTHHTTRRYRPLAPLRLTGWHAAAAFATCALPVLLGFVVPAIMLLRMAWREGDPLFAARFAEYAGNSLALASLAAAATVALALALAYARRLTPTPLVAGAVRVAGIGYAIPGSIVAVGILVPLGLFDNALDASLRATFGVSSGLLLSGTLVALVYAYVVRFLAVALGPVETGMAKITPAMDDVAASLGARKPRVLRFVHMPLMGGSILTAALLVFVDVLKELPATLIVRPFGFDTLAIRVYSLASDERLGQAATGSVAIVAAGLIPVAILSWMIARARPGAAATARAR
jgi:iron(III) transport system permease protein